MTVTTLINNAAHVRPLTQADAKLLLAGHATAGRTDLLKEFIAMGFKYCPKCRSVHPIEAFNLDSRRFDGRHVYCRSCDSLRARARKEKAKASQAGGGV